MFTSTYTPPKTPPPPFNCRHWMSPCAIVFPLSSVLIVLNVQLRALYEQRLTPGPHTLWRITLSHIDWMDWICRDGQSGFLLSLIDQIRKAISHHMREGCSFRILIWFDFLTCIRSQLDEDYQPRYLRYGIKSVLLLFWLLSFPEGIIRTSDTVHLFEP